MTSKYIPNTNLTGPNAWSDNFSYDYFTLLLKTAQNNFEFFILSEAKHVLESRYKKYALFLRHDIDVSIESALKMAEIEYDLGIKATYCIRINTDFYSLNDPQTKQNLKKIQELNHEIGLHYDHTKDGDISSSCLKLEDILKKPILSISFHIPKPDQVERGNLLISGKINAYAPELRSWYMSDSSGRWWDGEPLPRLRNPKGQILQILIHPIWWGEKLIRSEKREKIISQILSGW